MRVYPSLSARVCLYVYVCVCVCSRYMCVCVCVCCCVCSYCVCARVRVYARWCVCASLDVVIAYFWSRARLYGHVICKCLAHVLHRYCLINIVYLM